MIQHKALVQAFVEELCKMDIAELLKFKEDGARKLKRRGIPKKICDRYISIIDMTIQVKQEGMGRHYAENDMHSRGTV